MIGSIVNGVAIIVGGAIGLLLKSGLPEKLKNTLMQGMALAVFLVGVQMAVGSNNVLVVILSLALGALIGETVDIEEQLERLGVWLEKRITKDRESKFSQGFVTTSLVYCVGAMAIMGALQSGLQNDHSILFAKAVIDGITAIVFASTLGVGVLFSSVPVFIYQGTITLLAASISAVLTDAIVVEMSATGGLLIAAIGLNLLGTTKIKVGNLLPAVFLPIGIVKLFTFLPFL